MTPRELIARIDECLRGSGDTFGTLRALRQYLRQIEEAEAAMAIVEERIDNIYGC